MNDTESRQEIERLQSQIASLEQLLAVHERTVIEQSERLERALIESDQARLQSQFQVAALEQLLEVHEHTTIEQAEQLEQAMAALEIARQQSEERLRTVITNVPVIIFGLDLHGIFTLSEGKGLTALGWQPGQVVGQSAFDVYRDNPALVSEVRRAVAGEAFSSISEIGTLVFETWYTPLRDQDGELAGTIGVSMDITERRQAEKDLLFRDRALTSSINAVMINSPDGKAIYVNDAFLKLFGYTREEAMQLTAADTAGTEKDVDLVLSAYQSQGFFVGECFSKRKDGTIFPVSMSSSPITDDNGRPIATQATFMDITERRQLEDQIRESLERRGVQVQTSTEVAQEIAAVQNLDELYRRVVTLIKERFGYYHAQIFRYDPTQDTVILVTGYGEAGEKMLAAGHKLVAGRGVVGTAANTGEPVLATDVTQDRDWRPNPNLPDTRGELAVPIKLRGQVLGVLDVQSDRVGALTAEDQLLLEGLCGQIAVAMESTRAVQELRASEAQMQETLRELERLNRAATREGWQAFLQTGRLAPAYQYNQSDIQPVQDLQVPQIEQAIRQNAFVPSGEENAVAAAPLSVRGAVIGALGVYDTPQHPLSSDQLALLREIIDQGALALENARLYQDTQRAAARERMIGEIAGRIRETLDMESMLRTATGEIRRALNLGDLVIRLAAPQSGGSAE